MLKIEDYKKFISRFLFPAEITSVEVYVLWKDKFQSKESDNFRF